ncbi:MAG: hypothetical protein IJO40_10580 [Thermoguttaceae bacterium]|nr:hypothetical protein [Thermoguttaceae bacterium]
MTTRFFTSPLAVGTLLVVFFVQAEVYVSAKTPIFSHFSANLVQRDDSNASNGRAAETDSGVDANAANLADSNDSNVDANSDGDAFWLRLDRNERGVPQRLATSIVRIEGEYRSTDGETRPVSVDLIGAIHLGEKTYYDRLNAEFKEYETVVFELVADKDFDVKDVAAAKEAKNRGEASPLDAISLLQESLSDALGLVYQTDGIDYSAPNLKRGDADADEFLKRLTTGGDIPQFFANSSLESLFSSEKGRFEGWALAYFLAKDKRLTLRRLFADELARTELSPSSNDAQAERETALIHYRNKIALKVAKQELEAGKTKIAVFYGAAHLDDLARRVEQTLENPRRLEPRWIAAWSMESTQK